MVSIASTEKYVNPISCLIFPVTDNTLNTLPYAISQKIHAAWPTSSALRSKKGLRVINFADTPDKRGGRAKIPYYSTRIALYLLAKSEGAML